jgi:hypothetical protein
VEPEPEGSSQRSQEPATGPYHEAIESAPSPRRSPQDHSDQIIPSTPRSSEWSLSLRLSHQKPVHFSPLSHSCHMPRPRHLG